MRKDYQDIGDCPECLYEEMWAVGVCCKRHGRRDCVACQTPDESASAGSGSPNGGEVEAWHLAEHCRAHGKEDCSACDVETMDTGRLCRDHEQVEWLEGQAWKAEAAREEGL